MSPLAASDLLTAVMAAAGSALALTLGAFALILLLTRLRVPLWLGVLAGTGALALAFGRGAAATGSMILQGAVQPMSIALAVVTVLLLAVSETMRRAGQLARIVELARVFLRRPAVAMAALPALIGLLPMPGGALFSAPMVQAAAGDASVSGDRLSAVNYWFRHIWEHWWPLYPGVILAMTLTSLDLRSFVATQFPLGVFMAAAGLLIFRKSHPALHKTARRPPAGHLWRLLWATSTIWIILIVWAAAGWAMAAALPRPAEGSAAAVGRRFVPLTAGLLVSLAWTIRMNRLGRRDVAGVFAMGSLYKMVVLVISVMIFQHAVDSVRAAPRIADELAALRVPPAVIVALLPLIAGLVTGLAVGFVGTSFPIVLAVVAAMGPDVSVRPYVALAYAFGHLGQMLSPLHVCHVVSNQYFQAPFRAVYRRILPSVALCAILAVAYFALLKWLLG